MNRHFHRRILWGLALLSALCSLHCGNTGTHTHCENDRDCLAPLLCVNGICGVKPLPDGATTIEPHPKEPKLQKEAPVTQEPHNEPPTQEQQQADASTHEEVSSEQHPEHIKEDTQKDTHPEMCQDGETRSCYSGAQGTAGVGPCQRGTNTCVGGFWSQVCENEVAPRKERCNNKDDDCDGEVDESLTQKCYEGPTDKAGTGICVHGTQSCTAGLWGKCTGQVLPGKETCNGKDDDCDGKVDEALTRSCYSGAAGTAGKGSCKKGTQSCTAGKWGSCNGQVVPKKETCNGKDDDCDGAYDEGMTKKTWYVDKDGDGYGKSSYSGCAKDTKTYCQINATTSGKCAAMKANTVTKGGDCCDSDKNAYPGQTKYFSVASACGGFDYNCNSKINLRYPSCPCGGSVTATGKFGNLTQKVKQGVCPIPKTTTMTYNSYKVPYTLPKTYAVFPATHATCGCYIRPTCGKKVPSFGTRTTTGPIVKTTFRLGSIITIPTTLSYPNGLNYCPYGTSTRTVFCR